jgi:hypothetical protein
LHSSTLTVRQSSLPAAGVRASVTPPHRALSFSHVFAEPSLIIVSVGPLEFTRAIFAVSAETSSVLVACLPDPEALPFSKTLVEGSGIGGSVDPEIDPVAMRFSLLILPPILVAIGEGFYSVALLHELVETA